MSKSAIKALTKAQEFMAAAGVAVNLVGYVTDSNVRKSWRNADALAALIINSAANAFQCENSTTFAENFFDDMAEAVERYISSNLDDWDGKSWTQKDTGAELDRLAIMVAANMAFESRASIVKHAAEEAHAEALEINAVVDDAVSLCKPFCDNQNLDHAAVINAVDVVRQRLPQMGYSARITVEMMISVRRLAKLARQKAAENYRAMMERCAKAGTGCNEIPF